MLTIKAAALLLIADHVAAFIANAPALAASGFKEQARLSSLRQLPPAGARFSRRGELSLSSRDGAPSWRYEVDDLIKAASPWGSSVEAEIIATDLLKRLPEVAADVSDATRRGKLLSEVVLARGTEARLTVEGVKAVNRQLREEIIPKALEAAPRVAKAASKSRSSRSNRRRSTGGDGGTSRSGDSRKGPMEGVAETLYSIRNSARGLTPQKIRDGLQTVVTESENVFSRTPSGLFSPEYSVEDAREGFEVRRYASYAVCSATMAGSNGTTYQDESALDNDSGITTGSGEGFNTLAGYLFGNNTQERAMDMTTPVNIDVSPAGGRTMSFVLPKDLSAEDAPTPRNPSIRVDDVDDGELLAVREFPGFATDGEVKRQLDALLGSLEREATHPWNESAEVAEEQSVSPWRADDPSGLSYRLMQYNPPYTLPWLRTNAVAVKVVKGEAEAALGAGAVDIPVSVLVDDGGGGR